MSYKTKQSFTAHQLLQSRVFLDLFENYLTSIHHLEGDHIVSGDFNIDFLAHTIADFLIC